MKDVLSLGGFYSVFKKDESVWQNMMCRHHDTMVKSEATHDLKETKCSIKKVV